MPAYTAHIRGCVAAALRFDHRLIDSLQIRRSVAKSLLAFISFVCFFLVIIPYFSGGELGPLRGWRRKEEKREDPEPTAGTGDDQTATRLACMHIS